MRRDSGFFSSPALTDQVNFFNNNLSELKSSVALFNALVSDVEKFCCQNSEEIKANKKLNALLSNLLNKSSELQQPMATRKIMRLRYLAADDRDRLHYISYYLKEYEVIFSSKRGITLEEISCAFAEIQTELENKRTLEDVRDGFFKTLGEFVSQKNHSYPEKALKIAHFMKSADGIKPHHQGIAKQAYETLAECCRAAAPWYSMRCCSR